METTQHYFCPQKHVLLVKDSEIGNNQITCQICESSVAAPFYVCHTCKYYVHKSCVIKELNHPIHPRHPLSLRQRYHVGCNSCGRYFGMSLMFSCVKCNFDLDVDCALMSNSIITCPEGQNCIQHSTHPHLLLLVDTIDDAIYKNIHARCFVCQSEDSPSDDRVYYGCKRCKYFLHQQCIDQFPQQIQTSLHPNHGCLSLRFKRYLEDKCFFCKNKDPRAFYFQCPQCDFQLCMDCKVIRVLNYKYHEHPLSFVKNMSFAFEIEQCNVYDTCFKTSVMSSSKEFQKTESFKFWCCDCDFELHLLCGPLPSTIKHESHVHSLLLVDSFIEDCFGEYYCDICETERNPRIRVYCCGECKYIAHVHCVISEIINVLKGDLKDVKLKVLGDDFWKLSEETDYGGWAEIQQGTSLLTLRDLILQLSEYELSLLKGSFTWDEKNKEEKEVIKMITQLETDDAKIDEVLTFSSFTENAFMSFIFDEFSKSFRERKMKTKVSDLALKIVDFEGYSIPLDLVPVFKNLLHKHGDIGSRSGYSKAFKSVCYFLICKVMKEMHITLVIDITKELLKYWYHHIKFVECYTNFKLGFVKASLEEITRDFFYLQLKQMLEIDIPTIMNKRIVHIKKKMAEYEEFCESTSKKKFVKEGFNKVEQLKWKRAGQVGDDIDSTSSQYFK